MIAKNLACILMVALVALLPAACGSDTKVTESKSGDAVKNVEQVSDANLDSYFDAFASGDPDQMSQARDLTSTGSIAEAYLIHQGAVANAYLDGGTGSSEQESSKVKDGYRVCDTAEGDDACATYAEFKSANGKLSSFTVNELDLTKRLAIGKGAPAKAGDLGSLRFVSSYQSASNYLFVTMDVLSSGKKLNLSSYDAKYRAPDGRQSTATAADGPTELGADSKATILIAFEKAKPGGELTLTISDEDYNIEKTITVKIG